MIFHLTLFHIQAILSRLPSSETIEVVAWVVAPRQLVGQNLAANRMPVVNVSCFRDEGMDCS